MIVPIVLAAGRSTRFKDDKTKLLHRLGEVEILKRVILNLEHAGLRGIRIVVGHQREDIQASLGRSYEYIVQESQRGTGDAVKSCRKRISGAYDNVLVVYGDKPLFKPKTIREFIARHTGIITIATVEHPNPIQYSEGWGTVLRYDGKILALKKMENIVECDAALYMFSARWLWKNLDYLEVHNGEYYLPDLVEIASRQGLDVSEYRIRDYHEAIGINTKEQFKKAELYIGG